MALAVSTMAHGASLLCRSYTKRWRKRPNPARKPSSDRIAEFSAWLPENCWIHLTERLDTAQPGNKVISVESWKYVQHSGRARLQIRTQGCQLPSYTRPILIQVQCS